MAEGVDIEVDVVVGDVVVAAIGAAIDVVDGAGVAADVDAGVAIDGAADVVAAIDIVDARGLGLADFDEGHVVDVGLAAAAEEAVGDGDGVGLDEDVGGDAEEGVAADVGEGLGAAHVAAVAAAEDVAHLAAVEDDVGDAGEHLVAVVAAEDGADGGAADDLAVGRGIMDGREGIVDEGGVDGGEGGVGDLAVEEDHDVLGDAGAVAAAEDGVDEAAGGVDVDEDLGLQGALLDILVVADGADAAVGGGVVVVVAVAGAVDGADAGLALDEEVGVVAGVPGAGEVLPVERVAVGGDELVDGDAGGLVVAEAVDGAHAVVAGIERAEDVALAGDIGLSAAVEVAEVAAAVGVAVAVGRDAVVGGGADDGLGEGASIAQPGLLVGGVVGGEAGEAVGGDAGGGVAEDGEGVRRKADLDADGATLDAGTDIEVADQVAVANHDLGLVDDIGVADVGLDTAAIGAEEDGAAVEEEVGGVVGRDKEAPVFVIGVVGLAVVVDEGSVGAVAALVGAVVEAVGAAIGVLQDEGLAVDDGVGAVGVEAEGVVVGVAGLGADVAADVVAAMDIAKDTAGEPGRRRAIDVGHAAAAIELLDDDAGAGDGVDEGAEDVGPLIAPTGHGDLDTVADDGVAHFVDGDTVAHVARVAAAIDEADAARLEEDGAHGVHGGAVVAAEEDTDVVAAGLGVEAVGALVDEAVVVVPTVAEGLGGVVEGTLDEGAADPLGGDGVVDKDELVVGAVDGADGAVDGGAVAAEEDGVEHAAEDVDHGVRAVDEVAAAEEVADAEVAAIAGEVGVVDVLEAVGGVLGVVDVDGDHGGFGHGTAIVVAAEGREDGAAMDVDGDAVDGCGGGDADEGVLGAAEERVDDDVVVGRGVAAGGADGDFGLLDVGDGAEVELVVVGHAGAAVAVLGLVDDAGVVVLARGAAPIGGVLEACVDDGGGRPVGLGILGGVGIGDAEGGVVVIVGREGGPGVDAAVEVVGLIAEAGVAAVEVGVDERVGHAVGGLDDGGVDALIGVEAAAAAVDPADVDGMVGIGLGGADLHGGASVALDPAGDVVAAIDGADGVDAVDGDGGVAGDIGDAAAAEDVALDDRGMDGGGEGLGVDIVGEVDEDAVALGGAVGVVDGDIDPGGHAGRGDLGDVDAEVGAIGVGDTGGVDAGEGGEARGGTGDVELAVELDQGLLRGRGGSGAEGGVLVARPVVVGLAGGEAGTAEARGFARSAVAEAHAAAAGLDAILAVALGDGGLVAGAGDEGGDHKGVVAIGQGGGGGRAVVELEGDTGEALALGEDGLARMVDDVDREVDGRTAGGGPGGVAAAVDALDHGVAEGVLGHDGVVDDEGRLGAGIGVAGHGPLAVGEGGAEGGVLNPVVALGALAVAVGNVGDGGTEVPVVELGDERDGGAEGEAADGEAALAADEVVAIAVVLLIVVAGVAGATPDAERGPVGGGDRLDGRGGRGGGVECEEDVAHAGLEGVVAPGDGEGVVLDSAVALDGAEAGDVLGDGVGAGGEEPAEGAVAEGVVVALLGAQAAHDEQQGQERQGTKEAAKGGGGHMMELGTSHRCRCVLFVSKGVHIHILFGKSEGEVIQQHSRQWLRWCCRRHGRRCRRHRRWRRRRCGCPGCRPRCCR